MWPTALRCGSDALGGPPNEILALDDRVYVGAKDHFFYCLMARDGRVDWRWRIGGDIVGVATSDENNVYFVAQDNVLRALNRKSGGQQWLRAAAVPAGVGVPSRWRDDSRRRPVAIASRVQDL